MYLRRIPTPVLSIAVGLALAAASRAQCPAGHQRASDYAYHSHFGAELALSGDTLLVGAPLDDEAGHNAGAAYFLEYEGDGFTEVAKFVPPSSEYGQEFGQAVDIDGDLAVVGSSDHQMAFAAGAGFLYRRGPGGWALEDTLFADEPVHAEQLGTTVAVEGERVVLGAPGTTFYPGRVLVFEKGPAGWEEVQELAAPTDFATRNFGRRVLLAGDRMVVSAAGPQAAVVLVYERGPGGWSHSATLVPEQSPRGLGLLDFDGERIVTTHRIPGGEFDIVPDMTVLLFEFEDGEWKQGQRLEGSGDSMIRFGASAALRGDRLLVGCRDQSFLHMQQEYAELFELEGGHWTSKGRIEPQLGGPGADAFGAAIVLWNDTAILGSPSEYVGNYGGVGALHLFNLPRRVRTLCASTPNSSGAAAELEVECTDKPSELALRAGPVPSTVGLFFCGNPMTPLPSWDGQRCVGGQLWRLPAVASESGALRLSLDLVAPQVQHAFTPGSSWAVQAWFRDTQAGESGANFSSAAQVRLAP